MLSHLSKFRYSALLFILRITLSPNTRKDISIITMSACVCGCERLASNKPLIIRTGHRRNFTHTFISLSKRYKGHLWRATSRDQDKHEMKCVGRENERDSNRAPLHVVLVCVSQVGSCICLTWWMGLRNLLIGEVYWKGTLLWFWYD